MKTSLSLLVTLLFACVMCGCCGGNKILDFSPTYYGSRGFAQEEYTFEITPTTTSIAIGVWRKLNLGDDRSDILIIFDASESYARNEIHFVAGESLEFESVFEDNSLAAEVTVPIIPENITEPVTMSLVYPPFYRVSKKNPQIIRTIIHLVPASKQ